MKQIEDMENTYMVYLTPDLAVEVKGERITFQQDGSGNPTNILIISGACRDIETHAVLPLSTIIIKQ